MEPTHTPCPRLTIILVPGAWHCAEFFEPLTKILNAEHYDTISVILPSIGAEPPLLSIDKDIEAVRDAVTSAVDKGDDVVIAMHSYGSVPTSEALKGLSKKERAEKGEVRGVIHLVFLASFVIPQGGSIHSALGGKHLPWFVVKGEYFYPANPQHTFYNDLPQREREFWASKLVHQSYSIIPAVVNHEPWRYIPSTYLICENDQALPPFAQHAMAKLLDESSGNKAITCTAGHSPFLSQPGLVANILRRGAGEDINLGIGPGVATWWSLFTRFWG